MPLKPLGLIWKSPLALCSVKQEQTRQDPDNRQP